jgi:hypothetical protein
LHGIEGGQILKGVFPSIAAVIVMTIALTGWLSTGKGLNVWILAPAGILIGGGVYVISLWLLRLPELTYIKDAFVRRLRK